MGDEHGDRDSRVRSPEIIRLPDGEGEVVRIPEAETVHVLRPGVVPPPPPVPGPVRTPDTEAPPAPVPTASAFPDAPVTAHIVRVPEAGSQPGNWLPPVVLTDLKPVPRRRLGAWRVALIVGAAIVVAGALFVLVRVLSGP
jgi:hypothetical protein